MSYSIPVWQINDSTLRAFRAAASDRCSRMSARMRLHRRTVKSRNSRSPHVGVITFRTEASYASNVESSTVPDRPLSYRNTTAASVIVASLLSLGPPESFNTASAFSRSAVSARAAVVPLALSW